MEVRVMRCGSLALGWVLLGLGVASSVSGVTSAGTVYKWVDQAGVTHFSDQPPGDRPAEELSLSYRKTNPVALQARLAAESLLAKGEAAGEEAASAADRQSVLAERQTNCQAAQDRVAKYTDARRLYKPGPNGERIYLNAEELDVEKNAAREAVDQWCNGG